MNLQENINRIKQVMGVISESQEREVYPQSRVAYHLTPDIYIENIKKQGLTAKSESKVESHSERIYLYLNPESDYKTLASDLWYSSKYKDMVKNYYLLEVDLDMLSKHKFYQDPQSTFNFVGIYTKQTIPVSAIKVVETISTQDLPASSIMNDKSDEDNELRSTIQNFDYDSNETDKWDEILKKMKGSETITLEK